MSTAHKTTTTSDTLAYLVDPALWVREVLGIAPARWQDQFLRAPESPSSR